MAKAAAAQRRITRSASVAPVTRSSNKKPPPPVVTNSSKRKKPLLASRRSSGKYFKDEQWWTRWKELQAYKARFGDTNVPFHWPKNPPLGFWCSKQRKTEKQGQLNIQRRKALDELGFEWRRKERTRTNRNSDDLVPQQKLPPSSSCKFEELWWVRWNELKTFKARFGDTNVLFRWPENPPLGIWCSKQRTMEKKGLLLEHRRKALDELNFEWCRKGEKETNNDDYDGPEEPVPQQHHHFSSSSTHHSYHDGRWWMRWNELKTYKTRFGNANVPSRWPENPALGSWCATQRGIKKQGLLLEHRRKALDELNFEWCRKGEKETNNDDYQKKRRHSSPSLPRNDEQWWKRYEELKAYKERFGDTNVPFRWQENEALGFWCSTQRTAKKHGQLLDHRRTALDKISFLWHCINDDDQHDEPPQHRRLRHVSSSSSNRSRKKMKTAEALYKTKLAMDDDDEVVEEGNYHEDEDEENDLHPPIFAAVAAATSHRAVVTPPMTTFATSLKNKNTPSSSKNQKRIKASSHTRKPIPTSHGEEDDGHFGDGAGDEEEEDGHSENLHRPVARVSTSARAVTATMPVSSSESGSFSSSADTRNPPAIMGGVQQLRSRRTSTHSQSSWYRHHHPLSSSIDAPTGSIDTATRRVPRLVNIVNQESQDERRQQDQTQHQQQQDEPRHYEQQPQEHHQQQPQQGASYSPLAPKACFYMLWGFYARNQHFNVSDEDDGQNVREQMHYVQSGRLKLSTEDLLTLLNEGLRLDNHVLRDLFESGMKLFLASIAAESTVVQTNIRATAIATTNSVPQIVLHLWEKCIRKDRFGNIIYPIERTYLTSAGFQWDKKDSSIQDCR